MPVRPSMQYIITAVRELIFDVDETDYKFTDQQIQDKLDTKRLDIYQRELNSPGTLTENGTIEWHDFFAGIGYWETDYLIQKSNGPEAEPDTAEPLIGKFFYTANQIQPLVITGKVYNIYGVAVSLLTTQVAELRGQISSWTADGTTITRIGQISDMNRLIQLYAGQAWGWGGGAYNQVKLVRRDLRN